MPTNSRVLRPAQRVRRRPEFERAYNTGIKIHGRLMTLFIVPNGGQVSRLGVAATRKIGSAVLRNRAKRLARELFRHHTLSAGLDVIIVPRREMLDVPFATLESEYLALLARRDRPRQQRPAREPRGRRPDDRRPSRV